MLSALIQGVCYIQYPIRIRLEIRRVIDDMLTQGLLSIRGKDKQEGKFA